MDGLPSFQCSLMEYLLNIEIELYILSHMPGIGDAMHEVVGNGQRRKYMFGSKQVIYSQKKN